ncbi:MAG: sensor histidine kinase [Geodermatophilaceae bacterium]
MSRWSLRARLTAAATVTVALLLSAAAALLVWQVRGAQLERLEALAGGQASTLAAAVGTSGEPRVPTRTGLSDVSQIIDSEGRVVASSSDIEGEPAAFDFPVAPAGAAPVLRAVDVAPLDGADYLVAGVATVDPPGYKVYVGLPLASVGTSTAALAALLAVGVPGLVAALAFLTWLLAGRALRPVEVLRRQAADITVQDLSRRVDVPRARDELSRLASTLNDLLDRLETSVRRQRQFVADAAHELRSPVAAIRSQSEVADSIDRDGEASALTKEAVRLSDLIDSLLALARLDATPRHRREVLDLDDLVFSQAHLLRQLTGISVDTHQISAAQVVGDLDLLTRAVRNLLDNAARHATSRITVSVVPRDDYVEVTIADDGPGIPAADARRVLERFTRLDNARTRDTGGVGLGLAIVDDVVTIHQGQLRITDNAPGARITITLPRYVPA